MPVNVGTAQGRRVKSGRVEVVSLAEQEEGFEAAVWGRDGQSEIYDEVWELLKGVDFASEKTGGAWTGGSGQPEIREHRTGWLYGYSHRYSRNGDDDAVPVMTTTEEPATRETITGGSSAPPARQAPLHFKSTPLGQVNKPDVTGEALRAVWRQSRTNAEKSRWWRTTSPETKEDETTREAATGGEDKPPRGKSSTQTPP
ncbi:hypothetical protein C8J57DRAFT_1229827 [Mycena rebaudengoi]|nr:hypothetical protein C8J57DRAFT_1229827 [Mycena rebaudengoi]